MQLNLIQYYYSTPAQRVVSVFVCVCVWGGILDSACLSVRPSVCLSVDAIL